MDNTSSDAVDDISQVLPPHVPHEVVKGPSQTYASGGYIRYCVSLILLALVGLFGAIPIGRSDWFMSLPFGSPFLQHQDAAFHMQGANCDVVIFGDSSAVTGLAPKIIEQHTGLKTCNVSEPLGIVVVTDTLSLDSYLANNKSPKFLVIAFSPENYIGRVTQWNKIVFADGMLLLLRHSWNAHLLRVAATHPIEFLTSLSFIWLQAIDGLERKYLNGQTRVPLDAGHFTLPIPNQKTCVGNHIEEVTVNDPKTLLDRSWTWPMRSRYQGHGTQVLFVSSPVPDCTPGLNQIIPAAAAKTDAPPEIYPLRSFNDSDRHFSTEGATHFSESVAALINKKRLSHHAF